MRYFMSGETLDLRVLICPGHWKVAEIYELASRWWRSGDILGYCTCCVWVRFTWPFPHNVARWCPTHTSKPFSSSITGNNLSVRLCSSTWRNQISPFWNSWCISSTGAPIPGRLLLVGTCHRKSINQANIPDTNCAHDTSWGHTRLSDANDQIEPYGIYIHWEPSAEHLGSSILDLDSWGRQTSWSYFFHWLLDSPECLSAQVQPLPGGWECRRRFC